MQTSYAWGSKQRRAKVQALASSPRFVAALQTAVVGGEHVLDDMLAVLAGDGSDASIDALIPRFSDPAALDQLVKIETHAAKTPAFGTMVRSVKERLQKRNDASPALEFARAHGFDVKRFKVHVRLHSTIVNANRAPIVQCMITLDSTSATWLSVSAVHLELDRRTSFTSDGVEHDELSLGRCEARELPAWVARARQKWGVTWEPPSASSTKLELQFAQWLRGTSV